MIEIYTDAPVLHVNLEYLPPKINTEIRELSFEYGDLVFMPLVTNTDKGVTEEKRKAKIIKIQDDYMILDASERFESRVIKETFVHFKDLICSELLLSGNYDDLDIMNTNITVTKEKRLYYTDDNNYIERFFIGDIIRVKNKPIPTKYIGKLVDITDTPTAKLDCSTPVNSCIKTITPSTNVELDHYDYDSDGENVYY